MSTEFSMTVVVQRYLDDRRQLGFELKAQATELMRFARYADTRSHRGPLTQDLIVGWAREHVKQTSAVTAARPIDVIQFQGDYLAAAKTQINQASHHRVATQARR